MKKRLLEIAMKLVKEVAITLTAVSAAISISAVSAITAHAAEPSIGYKSHVAQIGWQGEVWNGQTSGTSGRSLQMECFTARVIGMSGGIEYRAHVQYEGWQPWKRNNEPAGTTGAGRRLEALQIRLYGEIANHYSVQYRSHCQNYGWMPWVSDGTVTGTTGQELRMEAIEVRLVRKNGIDFSAAKAQYPNNSTWNGSYKNKAWQCHGWACTIADKVTGSDPYNWNKVRSLNSLKPGDIVRFKRPHSIIITDVSGDTITYADCNWVGKNTVKWNQQISRSQLTKRFGSLDYVMSRP